MPKIAQLSAGTAFKLRPADPRDYDLPTTILDHFPNLQIGATIALGFPTLALHTQNP